MPDATTPTTDPRTTGKRIEALLEASAAAGPAARERSEELVRLVVDLYGAGLERLLELVDETVGVSGDLLERLADDDLVASLLLVSGLHPFGVEERIGRALDSVRPYLGSHGGDVTLVGISDDGVVQLRMLGSCDGCPSSSVTLELAVTEAIEAAAPEVTGIAVEPARAPAATSASTQATQAGLIPVDSLRARTREQPPGAGGSHLPLDDAADLPDGTVRHLFLDGMPVLLCRWRDARYAYRDLCPQCASDFTAGMGTAALSRELASGAPLLTCPGCGRHYDVHRAGLGREDDAGHLEPFPLLERDGRLEVVLPAHPPVPV
ncbi:MAG TPA: NifU family protein [Frankiaceae bacterium]|nr:NifU family protein [Frankiaceae bacterium]